MAFHWTEAQPHKHDGVPAAMAQPLRHHELAMRGTDDAGTPVRCIALAGTVGRQTDCRVYASRPAPCRDLGAAWEHGQPSPQCDRARAIHGLPPLAPSHWAT